VVKEKHLPKGTLVQIIDDAVSPHFTSEMRRMMANHGHLWIIDEPIRGYGESDTRKWYWCKALSSGAVYDWNSDELTPFKEGDVNAE